MDAETDSKGLATFEFKGPLPEKLEFGVHDFRGYYPKRALTADIVRTGVAESWCGMGKHVPFEANPGEMTIYFQPSNFFQRLMRLFWE